MRIPVDRRAWPKTFVLLAPAILFLFIYPPAAWVLFFILLAHLAFFRDPERIPPPGDLPLAPADGTVSDISVVFEDRFLKEEAIRIGLFLSIFVPHVNRSSANGTVAYLEYEPGKFLNALNKDSAKLNESNWIGIQDAGRCILMRQISGAIARRIHCDVKLGEKLERGQRIGIICYGSRAECYIPKKLFRAGVNIGDKVKAGETILGEWLS